MSNQPDISVSSECKDIGCLSTWKMLGAQWVFVPYIENYGQHILVIDI